MKRLLTMAFVLATGAAMADAPTVEDVVARASGDGTWRFDVTIRHPDTGWEHYADGWEVLDADGNRLGFRELAHPHVNEQPFTRSLHGVAIPDEITQVFIRSRCNVDGWSEALTAVDLSAH